VAVREDHGDRAQVVALAELGDAVEGVLARIDHDRLGARSWRDQEAVGLELSGGEPCDEHVPSRA
jgi:hypothetical protein